jgi:hypothetical protein
MLQRPDRIALVLAVLWLFRALPLAREGGSKPGPTGGEQAARDALAILDKGWTPYDNKSNLGDARWKVSMEALVRVVRAGPEAVPVLVAAAKPGSPWSDSTRAFAAKALQIARGPTAARDAIAGYDTSAMDTARVGKPAPDFTLPDAGGESYRLGRFRGKKIVVLTFVVADT